MRPRLGHHFRFYRLRLSDDVFFFVQTKYLLDADAVIAITVAIRNAHVSFVVGRNLCRNSKLPGLLYHLPVVRS